MIPIPLPPPRARLAAALSLLAGAALVHPLQPESVQQHAALHGWRLAGADDVAAALSPTPSFRVGDESRAGRVLRFSSAVRPPGPGRYRLSVEAVNLAVAVSARDRSEPAAFGVKLTTRRVEQDVDDALSTTWFESDGAPFDVEVRWETVTDGAARGRLLWERAFDEAGGFPPEPISSRALVSNADGGAPTRVALEADLERKGCWNCHAAPFADSRGRTAPKLGRVRERLGTAWIAEWIANPGAKRPGADMPSVIPGGADERRREAVALARFLASLAPAPDPRAAATEESVIERGRRLFHSVGCVACHGAFATPAELLGDEYLPNTTPTGPAVAPLSGIDGKWRPAALSAFLQDPLAAHPDGRMPDMDLDSEEADAIATWMTSRLTGPPRDLAGTGTDEERALGRELFALRRCDACHELDGVDLPQSGPAPPPAVGADARDACLGDPSGVGDAPRYDLDGEERERLANFVQDELATPPADLGLPQRAVALALERSACRACHVADGVGGPKRDARIYFWTEEEETDLGDEGRFPPDLTGVGHKLSTSWLREVLERGGVARPYMATRMPHFGAENLDGLAEAFAGQQGLVPDTDLAAPEATDELVRVGHELMATDRMACVTCHVVGGRASVGTEGPDLFAMAERLRYEWWRSYVHDPHRYKPGTRMPSFGTGNASSFPDELGGDLSRQADAIWAYLFLGEFAPLPSGVGEEGAMAIEVGERPVVHRCFLPEVGARAIAVGFPSGVHVAFDAERVRLAQAWTGEFLDAAGSWAGRGGQELGGRGDVVWAAEDGPAFWIGPESLEHWPTNEEAAERFRFRGYSIGADGVPTFRYEFDRMRITERVATEGGTSPFVRRSFEVFGLDEDDFVHERRRREAGIEDPDGDSWDTTAPILDEEDGSYTFTIVQQLRSDR